jgi:hydroxymethylpyrimidine/phosphomethylpyrimidine kinase
LLADLRAFAAASVWGCGTVAVNTVQSTRGLVESHPIATRELTAAVRHVLTHQNIRSIKLGALGSAGNVRALGKLLRPLAKKLPLVIDPVMSATRTAQGERLLDEDGTRELLALVRSATLVTPNAPEAERLVGFAVRTTTDAERAARALVHRGARAVLVKGGHLSPARKPRETVDVLAVGDAIVHLRAPRVRGQFHGTGCTLASLIAGKMAARSGANLSDRAIVEAVQWAKQKLTRALEHPARIGPGLLVLPL